MTRIDTYRIAGVLLMVASAVVMGALIVAVLALLPGLVLG